MSLMINLVLDSVLNFFFRFASLEVLTISLALAKHYDIEGYRDVHLRVHNIFTWNISAKAERNHDPFKVIHPSKIIEATKDRAKISSCTENTTLG